jgi:hypothetical protein
MYFAFYRPMRALTATRGQVSRTRPRCEKQIARSPLYDLFIRSFCVAIHFMTNNQWGSHPHMVAHRPRPTLTRGYSCPSPSKSKDAKAEQRLDDFSCGTHSVWGACEARIPCGLPPLKKSIVPAWEVRVGTTRSDVIAGPALYPPTLEQSDSTHRQIEPLQEDR